MTTQRLFNGLLFDLERSFTRKSDAQKAAQDKRLRGYNVRVLADAYGWSLWTKSKPGYFKKGK